MNIVIFGGTGMIGSRVVTEALARGHNVTVVVRAPANASVEGEGVTVAQGDVRDAASVAKLAAGQDAVVSAISPSRDGDVASLVEAAQNLIAALPQAGVRRLVVVNGAGSLEVAPGVQLIDTPPFPEAWKPVATAHRDALDVLRASGGDLEWTALSPAALIAPGERTGNYRVGTEQLVADDEGNSRISAEDYAVALLDELETPRFVGMRFTVGY